MAARKKQPMSDMEYKEPSLEERVRSSLEWQVAQRIADKLADHAAEELAGPVGDRLGLQRSVGSVRVALPDGAATTHAPAKMPRPRRIC